MKNNKDPLYQKVEEFKKNPNKALIKLAIPVMIGMLVQIIYNITDTAFVGRLGVNELAATTFSFPIMFVFIALGNLIGLGTNTRIARHIGAKKKKLAEKVAGEALTLTIISASITTILGLTFNKYLFQLMGATPEVIKLGIIYMTPIFAGTMFLFLSSLFSAILNGEGNTKLPSIIKIISAFLNLSLDAIFIYVFHLGVLGVALATMLAFIFEAATFSYLLFIKKNGHIKIRFKKPTKEIFKALKIGLPISMANFIMACSFLIFNKLFSIFGTNEVAAYGLIGKVDSIAFMPLFGLSISLVTLTGMFYGAKEYHLIPKITKAAIKYGLMFVFPLGAFSWFFPKAILQLMTNNNEVLTIGSSLLKIAVFGYPLMVIAFMLGRSMMGLGDGKPGLIITITRLVLLAVPLAWIFITILKLPYQSIMYAIISSSLCTSIIAIMWFKHKIKKLYRKLPE